MLYLTAVLATALAISVVGLLWARRAVRAARYRRLQQVAAIRDLHATQHHLASLLVVTEAENVIYQEQVRALEGDGDA